MTNLDETGLKAARDACEGLLISHDFSDGDLAAVITAYLAAVRTSDALRDLQRLGQECEQDRLAVVSQSDGKAFGATFQNGTADEQCARLERLLMLDGNAKGPFRRQIVTIPGGLLRPEPVGEVVGSVEG